MDTSFRVTYPYHTHLRPLSYQSFQVIIFQKLLELLCSNISCVRNELLQQGKTVASMGSLSSFEQEFSFFSCLYHTQKKIKKLLELLCSNISCVTNYFNREKSWLAWALCHLLNKNLTFSLVYITPKKKKKTRNMLA